MNVQAIVSDVRSRVATAGQQSQDAFSAYVDAQRKALNVVTRNGQTLANTEIGAAKNVFAAARASFDQARKDGVRQVAQKPQAYVPNGRAQIVSAYKDTIDLLVKTSSELTDVVSGGYKSVLDKLTAKPTKAKAKKTTAKNTPAKKTTAAKSGTTGAKKTASSAQKTTAAKRKTTTTRKTSAKSGTSTTKSAGTKSASTTAKKANGATTS